MRPFRFLRRGVLVIATALATVVGLPTARPADAAATTIDNALFSWSMNQESHGAAYFGGCNFFSAGTAGSTGSSRPWTQADGFYSTSSGNVTLRKPDSSGTMVAPTWATKCQGRDGTAVTSRLGSWTETRVVIAGGTGTVDAATGTATISWQGSWTVVQYGGMTYWTVSNPRLTVNANGTGQVTATLSGYGADMVDASKWVPLTPRTATLANLTGVSVTAAGFTVTPDYRGVKVQVGADAPQVRDGDSWGAFPQSLVEFAVETGQAAYWYSSGGAVDAKKVATPLTVAYTLDGTTPVDPGSTSGSGGSVPQPGRNQQSIAVTVAARGEPGEFVLTIPGSNSVTMGSPTYEGNRLRSTGQLSLVQVTDLRRGSLPWSVSGQVGDFTGGLSGRYLGWTPKVMTPVGAGAVPGPKVASGLSSGNGLKTSSILASATAGHALGTATLGADLDLHLPAETDPGTYTVLLTLTAVS